MCEKQRNKKKQMKIELPSEASIIFGLRWMRLISQRPLGFYFIPTRLFVRLGDRIATEFGIDEEYMQEKIKKKKLNISLCFFFFFFF